jgi:hypothetical protein
MPFSKHFLTNSEFNLSSSHCHSCIGIVGIRVYPIDGISTTCVVRYAAFFLPSQSHIKKKFRLLNSIDELDILLLQMNSETPLFMNSYIIVYSCYHTTQQLTFCCILQFCMAFFFLYPII